MHVARTTRRRLLRNATHIAVGMAVGTTVASSRVSAVGTGLGGKDKWAEPPYTTTSRKMPESVHALPVFGTIEWTVRKLPFVPDGPGAGISGMGFVHHGGCLYLMGGFIPAGDETKDLRSRRTSRWTYRYSLETDEWTRLADMPGRREYTRAIVGQNAVYAVGGAIQLKGAPESYRPCADCFRLDLTKDPPSWARHSQLHVPRTHTAVGAVGPFLIVAGGNQYNQPMGGYRASTIRRVTEIFDLAHPEQGWQLRQSIPGFPRGWTASSVCGGRLYIFGGVRFSERGKGIKVPEALSYDPVRMATSPPAAGGDLGMGRRHVPRSLRHHGRRSTRPTSGGSGRLGVRVERRAVCLRCPGRPMVSHRRPFAAGRRFQRPRGVRRGRQHLRGGW